MEKSDVAMIRVRIPREIYEKMREIAKKDRRSFNSAVVFAMEEYMRSKEKEGWNNKPSMW